MNVRTAVHTSLAVVALTAGCVPALRAQWGVSLNVGMTQVAPPPLVEVDQPVAPGDGYLWTPGYWAWDDDAQDYYWVDGEWVMAPEPGLLWTPGYWGYESGSYLWHASYWGEHVGFYGGVNYGFGYFGSGYAGGFWNGNRFYYNTAVNRIDLRFIRTTYSAPVAYPLRGGRVAFNGGPGGVAARPSRDEQIALQEHHFQPTPIQQRGWQGQRPERGFEPSRTSPDQRRNIQGSAFSGSTRGWEGDNRFGSEVASQGAAAPSGADGWRGRDDRWNPVQGRQAPVITQPGAGGTMPRGGERQGWTDNSVSVRTPLPTAPKRPFPADFGPGTQRSNRDEGQQWQHVGPFGGEQRGFGRSMPGPAPRAGGGAPRRF